jgi:hypothetical protein
MAWVSMGGDRAGIKPCSISQGVGNTALIESSSSRSPGRATSVRPSTTPISVSICSRLEIRKAKRVLYSRGFASIFGEWETTDEARAMMRTFHESLRFPVPESPVEVVLKKRDAKNSFREAWFTIVDPKDRFIDRSKTPAPAPLITIQKMGDPAAKVDFLILGDGYA